MRSIKILCLSAIAIGVFASSYIFTPAARAQSDGGKIWYTIFHKAVRAPKGAGCSTSEYAFVLYPSNLANYRSTPPAGFTKSNTSHGNSSTSYRSGWCYKSVGLAACEKSEKDRAVYVEHTNSWGHSCLSVFWNSALIYKK